MLQGRHVALFNWRDTGNPEGGGAERYLEKMAAGLVARGCRVSLVCAAYAGAAPQESIEGVRVIRRGSKLTVYLRGMLLLLSHRLGGVDVVVDVQNGLPFFTRMVTRKPVVVLVHHVHREQWPVVYPGTDRPRRVVDRKTIRTLAVPRLPVRCGVARDPRRARAARRRPGPGSGGAQRNGPVRAGRHHQDVPPECLRGGPAGAAQAGRARDRRRTPAATDPAGRAADGRRQRLVGLRASCVCGVARRGRRDRVHRACRRGPQAGDLRTLLGDGVAFDQGRVGPGRGGGGNAQHADGCLPLRRWHPGVDRRRRVRPAGGHAGRVHGRPWSRS